MLSNQFSPLLLVLLFGDSDSLCELIDNILKVLINKTFHKVILKFEYNYAEMDLFSLIFAFSADELSHPTQFTWHPSHEFQVAIER